MLFIGIYIFYLSKNKILFIFCRPSIKRAHILGIIYALSNACLFFAAAALIAVGTSLIVQGTVTFEDMYM